ncbi:MAG: carbamoyltransferase C-terminal domain-containing protein [Pseudomonadota bacterium]
MNNKYYIGLSVTYHDPAIAIVDHRGEVLFAEATERYLQYKRAINCEPDSLNRISGLLRQYCAPGADFVVALNWRKKRPYYEKLSPILGYFSGPGLMRRGYRRYTTFLEKYKIFHMLACQANAMAKGGINLVRKVCEDFPDSSIAFLDFDHHLTHAAAACYTSPFKEAGCCVVDSYGERGSMAFYRFQNSDIRLVKELKGIESLGFYYMKLTELCGFDWLKGEEWKVMGLAPYGRLDDEILALLQPMLRIDGLAFRQDLAAVNKAVAEIEHRRRDDPAWSAADMAYTGQHYFATLLETILNQFHRIAPFDNLAMAGGCALNSAFCGQILYRTPYQRLHIPSAPADDGTALGAALLAYHRDHPGQNPRHDVLTPYLGSSVAKDTVERLVRWSGLPVRHLPDTISLATAELLAQGKLVAWAQGRAEFGPRALGNRSILADPRRTEMKDTLNALVKFREGFRPFAPSILHEHGEEYFQDYQESPYMERTLTFRETVRHKVPAVVHVDGTGRLQTIKREWNPRFYELIDTFRGLTGVPILLNTSLNIMGSPIVHSVEDIVGVFLSSGLDAMVIDDYLFLKPGRGT